jgi:hypothetical protein
VTEPGLGNPKRQTAKRQKSSNDATAISKIGSWDFFGVWKFGIWRLVLMETPAQTCLRLLAALEDLATQEAAALDARNFPAAVAIQTRAAPLVEHLAAHGPPIAEKDAAFRARVAAFHARRRQTGEWLATQVARAREELLQMQVSQRRVAQIAPAYGSGGQPARQLCAVG